MVEMEGKGITAACQLPAAEGLRIRTESPLLRETRRTALELLLTSHVGDCLSCPKDTRCELQKVAAYLGVERERSAEMREFAPSFATDDSNPFFRRDPNRCVLCGICVRTCERLQGVSALDYSYSSSATTISAAEGLPVTASDCESCGECVVRCPTGALTPVEGRLPAREVRTTCVYCGVGCSLYLGVRGEEVVSVRGDREGPANRGRLCVKGRYGHSFINHPDRLTKPLIKRDGAFVPATWDEALDLVASRLSEYRGDRFFGIGSSRCTNEENYLFQKFVRGVMGTNNVDNCARLCHAPTVTGLSRAFGTGGGTNPIEDISGARCLLVIGSNTTMAHAVAGARVRQAADGATLIVVDPRRIDLCDHADMWLPLQPGTDVALLMGMAKAIYDAGLHDAEFIRDRCEGFDEFVEALAAVDMGEVERVTGVSRPAIVSAATAYATRKPASIIYSLGITEHTHGTDNVLALANLAMLTGNIGKPSAGIMPMRGQNNVQGACDMGCSPGAFPGYQPVTNEEVRLRFERAWGMPLPSSPGVTLVEALQRAEAGEIKALYIMGMDAAYSVADAKRAQAALETAEFVVCQDIFLTGTAEFADVVLPAASFAEKDGTFTNLERRVQRVRQAIEPVGDSRPDSWIIREIARRMGHPDLGPSDAAGVMDEIASVTPSFAGISFERLERESLQWPCYGPDQPGSVRLHVDRFNTPSGKGRFSPLTYRPPAESADADYPLILTTGRSLYHFHLAMTSKVPGLVGLMPEDYVWVHPDDAALAGIRTGDRVKVSSRRGEVLTGALVTDVVIPGTAFMTFHFYATPTNVLTQQALDPVAKTPEFKVTAVRVERVAESA
jgi:formate dehydrogenase alpha subunit